MINETSQSGLKQMVDKIYTWPWREAKSSNPQSLQITTRHATKYCMHQILY